MPDLVTMVDRLARELRRPDLLTSIDDAIRSALAQVEVQPFDGVNVARLRINTVADQQDYTIPDDLLAPDGSATAVTDVRDIGGIIVAWQSTGDVVVAQDWRWIEWQNTGGTTGQPVYYARLGSTLRFAPIPDAVYTLRLHGVASWSADAASGVNPWFSAGEQLLRATATRILARDVLLDDAREAAATRAEAAARASLARRAASHTPNRLRSWGAC